MQDMVLGSRLASTGFFNTALLKQMVEQHQSGMRDHSSPLWSLLMFDSFLKLSERGAPAPVPAQAALV